MRPHRCKLLGRIHHGVVALVAVTGMTAGLFAEPSGIDFGGIKRKACASIQAEYDQAVAAAEHDPLLAQYQDRLASLDMVAETVLRDLASFRADYLAKMTATVDGGNSDGQPGRRGAAKILEEAQPQFAPPLPLPSASSRQQAVLHDYYATCLAALQRCVAKYAADRALPGANDDDVAEIHRLCMVLPLLASPEEAWSIKDMEAFPDWMKSAAALTAAEEFALRLRRPVTALQLRSLGQNPDAPKRPASDAELAAYLRVASDTMLRSKDYEAARQYLSRSAELAGSPREKGDAQLRLAEVLGDVGDPKGAAKELSKVLAETSDGDTYGRAAMLRLKYLYEDKAFGEVLAAVPAYQQDPRCEPYLPQTLYITWVASRQQNAPAGESERWQKAFLDRYPDHPLGADMHFASAMGLLAESRYDEARKVLKYVEIHYPKSKVAGKAREIAQRLQSVTTRPTRG